MGKRILNILTLLFLCSSAAVGQDFSLYNIETANYPIIEADFLVLDEAGFPVSTENAGDIVITENGKPRTTFSVECSNLVPTDNVSVILSIDISQSMEGQRLEFAKAAARELINTIDMLNNEVAIQTFNEESYIEQDFTNKKNLLEAALNRLTSFGGTNFDATFISDFTGVVDIANGARAGNKAIAIVLTDGIADGDEQEIIDSVTKSSLTVYTVTIGTDTPALLKNVAEVSGGTSFANITNENEIKKIYKIILRLSQGVNPCKVKWISDDCESFREVNASVRNTALNDIAYYKVPAELFSGFEYLNDDYVEFGNVPANKTYSMKIKLKAINEDIQINKITSNNPLFSLNGFKEGTTFSKGDTKTLDIIFKPQDRSYQTAEFTIDASGCFGMSFYASGGDKYDIGDKKLEITYPNGGEQFAVGDDINVKWKGLIPSDYVELHYSSNSGQNWNMIYDSAKGLSHTWRKIPDNVSDNYLIKAIQYSNEFDDSSIIKINELTKPVGRVIWNESNNLIIGFEKNGAVVSWNSNTGIRKEILFEQEQVANIISLDQTKDNSLLAYADSSSSVKLFNLISGKPAGELLSNGERITKIRFSPTGSLIAGIASSGNLFVWRISDRNLIHTIQTDEVKVNDFAWNFNGTRIITAGKSGSIRIWNSNDKKLMQELTANTTEAVAISWSKNDQNIAVLTSNNKVNIWIKTGDESYTQISSFTGKSSKVKTIEYSPDINYIAEIGNDNNLYIRRSGSLDKVSFEYDLINEPITSVSWNRESSIVALGTHSGKIHLVPIEELPLQQIVLQEDQSDDYFSVIKPQVQILIVDMGEVKVHSVKDSVVNNYVTNTGEIDLIIDSLSISGQDAAYFEIKSVMKEIKLQKDSTLDVEVSFSPSDKLGLYRAELNVHFKGTNFKKDIFGTGVDADLVLSTNIINFGKVNLGKTKDTLEALVINVSDKDITIDSVRSIGPDFTQFSFLDPTDFILAPGDSQKLSVSFNPQAVGKTSGQLAFYFDSPLSPVRANLFGEGIAPKAEFNSNKEIEIVCFPEDHYFSVDIKNSGKGQLEIFNYSFTGENADAFEVVNPADTTFVEPEEQTTLQLFFKDHFPEDYSAKFVFETNMHEDGNTDFEIDLKVKKDSSGIILNKNIIEFIDAKIEREYEQQITITNTGSIPIVWNTPINSGRFVITEIVPSITMPQSTSTATIKFLGAEVDGSYSAVFDNLIMCENSASLEVFAYVGINLSKLEVIDSQEFEVLKCVGEKDTSTVVISNSGKSPLKIFSAYISNDLSNSFKVIEYEEPPVIMPDETVNIKIEYTANETGKADAVLNIESNATNVNEGLHTIEMSNTKLSTEFELSESEINFDSVLNNFSDSVAISIKNLGNTHQAWEVVSDNPQFLVEPEKILEADNSQSVEFMLYFSGGLAGEVYSAEITVINECNERQIISVSASVIGYAQVGFKAGEAAARPGDTVQIPIYIYSPEQINLPDIKRYTTTVCFDHSLLFPIDGTPGGTLNGDMRCILIDPLNYDANDIIYNLKFLALLGDTTATPIIISNSTAYDTSGINIEEKSGFFNLIVDSNNLIDGTEILALKPNIPNPALGTTHIKFTAIENGLHRLYLINTRGQVVSVLFEGNIEHGDHQVFFNAEQFPQGFYIYRLITPNNTLEQKMLIVR